MKYNFAIPSEVERAKEYFATLVEKKALAEVTKISPKRTLNQNSYLHLIIGAFGVHFGYTLEEAKQIYKDINVSLYEYEKKGVTGVVRKFYRSSADLDKEEMAKSIDHFRLKSDEAGYPLPLATDQGWLREIENAIEQSKYYL
jgi:hypothetical protein